MYIHQSIARDWHSIALFTDHEFHFSGHPRYSATSGIPDTATQTQGFLKSSPKKVGS